MKPGMFTNTKSSFYGYLKVINSFYSVNSEYKCEHFCSDVSAIKIKREHYPKFSYLQCLGEGCKVRDVCEQNKLKVSD